MSDLIINIQSSAESIDPLLGTMMAGYLGFMLIGSIINCLVGLLIIFSIVIFIMALIDIVQRENWKEENDKVMWLLLIIFVPLAQFYYYFVTKKDLDKRK
ncbi:MAG TPA: PLDc N-terminal domain-containing protein [Candidatus Dojkabacteria bacterium]|nr:PLDc N-terminal domain-containing protein [Candidatus Dojkabacteria bacterium]HRO64873.1 PLDc N-terminal domain-containing protein [Candidatus Dojkabacteria bacterium]HRP51111.1 PLDc N-terminal domain-containing protein [Candidatus Dojkabacteria bacterium]